MVSIRAVTSGDLDQLGQLFDNYRKFYKQSSNVEEAKIFLKERIAKKESVIFVAEENEQLIGFTQLYPIFSSVGLKKAWLLNDLFVDESSRNRGIAASLLEAARQFGVESNSGWLLLQTNATNSIAQSLYEKVGWVRENDFFYRLDLLPKN